MEQMNFTINGQIRPTSMTVEYIIIYPSAATTQYLRICVLIDRLTGRHLSR